MPKTIDLLTVKVGSDIDEALRGLHQVGSGAVQLERKVGGSFSRLRGALTKTRSAFGLLAGATGAGLAAKAVFDLGARVQETGSKFRTVFGESTREVQTFIDSFGTIAGLSNEQAQAITATTGSIVQGMGIAGQSAAKFSVDVVKLAGDLSSFNNVPVAETAAAINAAITGEREQLKQYGIVLLETDVQKRALLNTGKKNAKQLTQEERATASLQLITERAGAAVGDLVRTQDSAANQARQLEAEIQNLKESMSVALLPALSAGVQGLNHFIRGLQITGAQAAVMVAKLELEFAKLNEGGGAGGALAKLIELYTLPGRKVVDFILPGGGEIVDFGLSVEQATRNLRLMQEAAAAVKFDIVGLANALTGSAGVEPSLLAVDQALQGLTLTAATLSSHFPPKPELFESASRSVLVFTDAMSQAQQITLQMRTPVEVLRDTIADLQEHLDAGRIGWETYQRAVTEAELQFQDATATVSVLGDAIGNVALQGVDAFVDFASGAGDAIGQFVKQAIADLARLALKMALIRGVMSFLPGVGSFLGFGRFLGGFASGGTIPASSFGLVAEAGAPEIVSRPTFVQGPARVTPTDAGGSTPFVVQFLTHGGRDIIDEFKYTHDRDANRGRLVRIPLNAVVR